MIELLNFSEYVVDGLLSLVKFIIIAYAILSWLIAFDIVNLRNSFVYRASRGLDAIVRPILRPIQRILPAMGGLDFSPIIVFLVIGGAQNYLLHPLFNALRDMVGGPTVL